LNYPVEPGRKEKVQSSTDNWIIRDYISARVTDFGAEVMVSDRSKASKKFSGAVIDKTTLEEIMLFYVNRDKNQWS